VNYYRRYVGDYLKKTMRLSLIEHGVYGLLLDYYYAEEKPLPLGHEEACRMIRAVRAEERRAVDRVLGLYFERREDGYHNQRADEELNRAAPLIAAARENGSKGGRRGKPLGYPVGSNTETQRAALEEPSGQHPPSSILQPKEKSKAMSGSPPDAAQPEKRKNNGQGNLAEAEKVLAYLNHAAGRGYHFRNPNGKLTPNADVIVARLAEGYTAEQLREVVMLKSERWKGDEKMAEFLRPSTLFGKQKFAQYVGELGA
jgi:uncharacterized phage protein (TIGR02220 family)